MLLLISKHEGIKEELRIDHANHEVAVTDVASNFVAFLSGDDVSTDVM